MERAAAYIRVSTEEQTEFSPDAQLFSIRQYAVKNNMIIDERFIFRDEGISGKRADNRPGFMQMVQAAKTKAFDVIIVHKFDRFARSREDSIIFKSLLRRECGVKVISVSEPLEDEKTSVLMEAILEAMGEYYSLNLSEEVKKGMTEKARRGELQTPAPFGYRMEKGLLTPYEPEAEFVREIFHKYVYGNMTPRTIAQQINAQGVRTIKGNRFEKRNIEYIICNPTYIGKMRWTPAGSVVCRLDFDNPETMIRDARHSAIVDAEIFEAANKKIRRRSRIRNKYERGEITTHWLQGVLRCNECFCTMSYGKAYGGRSPAYRCNRYLGGGCEYSQRLTVDKAEKAILGVFREDSRAVGKRMFERNAKEHIRQTSGLRRQIEKIDAKLQKARELAISGIDTPEEYRRSKAELTANKNLLLEKLNAPTDTPQSMRIKSPYDILVSETSSLSEKNSAVKELVRYIAYDKKNDTLSFYYYSDI